MHFLIVGCGSIGQRHLRNLMQLNHKVTGCETNNFRAKQVSKRYGIEVFTNLKKALTREFNGAFICTPTNSHLSISIEAAKKGLNLFIEKPLSDKLDKIGRLSTIVDNKKLIVLVGCNTRFLPSFKLTKRLIEQGEIGKILAVKAECGFYLPYWHPFEDYRKSYSANRNLGGGVILDDIHEIDALYWLFGKVKEVFCFADKISNLDIDTEDIAEIFLKFNSGVVAQVHLDYLQRTYRRYYEFIGEKGIIVWNYINQQVKLYTKNTNQYKIFQENINITYETMFLDEIKYFINCIKSNRRPINDLNSAKKALEIALASYKSAKSKKVIYL